MVGLGKRKGRVKDAPGPILLSHGRGLVPFPGHNKARPHEPSCPRLQYEGLTNHLSRCSPNTGLVTRKERTQLTVPGGLQAPTG